MRILVTGGTGFVGTALCQRLLADGAAISIVSRTPQLVAKEYTAIASLQSLAEDAQFDAVINLAGANIAGQRWSSQRKQTLLHSRIDTTKQLVEWMGRSKSPPKVLISASAIGYYGIGENITQGSAADMAIVDESVSGDDSFSSQLCQQWEQQAMQASALGVRVCCLRIGIVLGPNGGALERMLLPFKLGLGGVVGSGKQWMPWIHRDDLIALVRQALHDERYQSAINAVSPNAVRNAEFTKTLAQTLKRPALLPMPSFVVTTLFGQMGKELLLSGRRVEPVKLQTLGFDFQYPVLSSALQEVVAH